MGDGYGDIKKNKLKSNVTKREKKKGAFTVIMAISPELRDVINLTFYTRGKYINKGIKHSPCPQETHSLAGRRR